MIFTAPSRPFAHAPGPLSRKVGGAAARASQGRLGEWLSGPTVAAIFGPPDRAPRRKGLDWVSSEFCAVLSSEGRGTIASEFEPRVGQGLGIAPAGRWGTQWREEVEGRRCRRL